MCSFLGLRIIVTRRQQRSVATTTHDDHCWPPSLSPTGWCSIIDLLDPCVSVTTRSSYTPVNVRTVSGFFTDEWDDTVQGLVSWRTSVKSYDVAKQCIPPTDDLIDAWKTSCNSNVYVLHVITPLYFKYLPLDISRGMTAVCACRLQEVSMIQMHGNIL